MKLREYQNKAIEKLRFELAKGKNRIILCSPTGSGKTVIFSEMARLAIQKNNSVLIITNRKELLMQTSNKLNEFDLYPDFLNANTKKIPDSKLVVSMVETLKRRLKTTDYVDFIRSFKLIIIDECHNNSFNRLFEILDSNQIVIGASATPLRMGKMKPLKEFYDCIIDVISVNELITLGFLSKPIAYGIPNKEIEKIKKRGDEFDDIEVGKFYDKIELYHGVIQNYKEYSLNQKTIIFCSTIENSKKLVENFKLSGYNAKHFDCYMPDNERNEVLNWFSNTKNAILSNVSILTTGFDCPDIKTIVIYRPTMSLSLYLQMVGRGSRITNDKNTFTILDFGNNIKRHLFWEDDRVWTLENKKKNKKDNNVSPVKNCYNCKALIHTKSNICKYCGYEYPKEQKKKTEIEVILEKLSPTEIQKYADNCNIAQLEEIRIAKGYKLGWILYKLKSYSDFIEYEKLRKFKTGWAKYNFQRFCDSKQ